VPGTSRLALPALLAGAAAIGLAPLLVRYARLEGVGPSAAAFYRLALALPVLWGWTLARRAPGDLPSRRDRGALLAVGAFFAADLAAWHWSILLTRVANATLLACLASVLATLGSWVFLRERFTRLFLAGLFTALAGSALLMSRSLTAGSRNLLGDALGFLAALFYAAYLVGVARLRTRCSTAAVMAWSGLGAALGLLAATLVSGERLLPATGRGWLVVAALALVAQVGGQTLIAFALAHLSVGFSAVSLLVQPVVAAALAWALFGEALGVAELAGAVLILAGIALGRLGSLPKA
jgi:drug/metabolite transporter (DMT)-like permease